MTTVAVLMGGWSPEREVSLVSGKACAEGLREGGHTVIEYDVKRDLRALAIHTGYRRDDAQVAFPGTGEGLQLVEGLLRLRWSRGLHLGVSHRLRLLGLRESHGGYRNGGQDEAKRLHVSLSSSGQVRILI